MGKQAKNKYLKHPIGFWFVVGFAALVFLYTIGCIVVHFVNAPQFLESFFSLGELAYTTLGALLGFGASIFVENSIQTRERRKAIDNIVDEVVQQIKNISTFFQADSYDNEFEQKDIDSFIKSLSAPKASFDKSIDPIVEAIIKRVENSYQYIYIPIWESVLQNGNLLTFRSFDFFDSLIKTYNRIILIKNKIESFNLRNYINSNGMIEIADLIGFIKELYDGFDNLLSSDINKSYYDLIVSISKKEDVEILNKIIESNKNNKDNK